MAVDPGSPAEQGGLRAGEVIVEFNGNPIADAADLTSRVTSTAAGTRVSIAYYRDNTRRTANVRVEELKE
jgi:S1-C subfamily serine protease